MIASEKRGDAVAASTAGAPPALFTSTSSRPKLSVAALTTASICSTSRTSAATKRARRPPASGSWSGWLRPQMTTLAPAARKRSVIPRPTPRPPPLTIATRPLKSSSFAPNGYNPILCATRSRW